MDDIQKALKIITDRMSQKSGTKFTAETINMAQSDGTNRTGRSKSTYRQRLGTGKR